MSDATHPKPTKRRRLLRRAALAAAILITLALLLGLVAIAWTNAAGSRARAQALAAVEAAGLPTTIPDSRNHTGDAPEATGTPFALATLSLAAFPDSVTEGVPPLDFVDEVPFGTPIPPDTAAHLDRFATATTHFRQMLHETTRHERFDHDIPWHEASNDGITLLGRLRTAARATHALSLHAQATNRHDDAIHPLVEVLHLSESFANEPSLVAALVQISIGALVNEAAWNALSRTQPSDSALAALSEALQSHAASIDLPARYADETTLHAYRLTHLDAYLAENLLHAALSAERMRAFEQDEQGMTLSFRLETTIPALAALPIWLRSERATSAADLEDAAWWTTLGYTFVPGAWKRWQAQQTEQALLLHETFQRLHPDTPQLLAWSKGGSFRDDPAAGARAVARTSIQARTSLDVTLTGLAVERYRLAHGRWPDSLNQLPEPAPTDPYTGQPLVYRHLPDGVTVYSLGPNRTDEGGVQGGIFVGRGDIAFRLLNPDLRGTLEAPEPPDTEPEWFNPYGDTPSPW